jgi:regulator of ribosome biosynthesis
MHQLSYRQECERQLDFDLGHLLAVHPSAPDDPEVTAGSEEALRRLATRATQSLVRQIFILPSHSTEEGRAVELPRPLLALPRAKPVPQPKPLTKWQAFAKEKGILKQKRSKLVYDENQQEWKRRHGYKKGNDETAVPIIEASADDKVGLLFLRSKCLSCRTWCCAV